MYNPGADMGGSSAVMGEHLSIKYLIKYNLCSKMSKVRMWRRQRGAAALVPRLVRCRAQELKFSSFLQDHRRCRAGGRHWLPGSSTPNPLLFAGSPVSAAQCTGVAERTPAPDP